MKWVAVYLAVYAAALTALAVFENFGIAEALILFILFGGGFLFLAQLVSRGIDPVEGVRMRAPWPLIALWLTGIAVLLVIGFPTNPWLKLGVKLIAFVVVPFFLFRTRFPLRMTAREWGVLAFLFVALTIFQTAVGSGGRKIIAEQFFGWPLVLGAIASFVWMSIEAGLVEEFAFRGVLQTRLEELTQSRAGGIVLASLVFGLVHAPGLYLRTGQTNEGFANPSLLFVIGYAIVILSPSGFFLGYLWSRTRNLLLVTLVHGAIDLVPNILEVAENVGIR